MTRTSLAPIIEKSIGYRLRLGICKSAEAEDALIAEGIHPDQIWMVGRGLESVKEAVEYCRGRPAEFALAEDLRILGGSQAAIFDATKMITRAGTTLVNIDAPDQDINDMQRIAFKALHSATAIYSHRTARRRGSKGGLAKAANAAARRRAEVSDEIARKVWQSRLTKQEKAAILGCTISTGDRHYGVHAT